MPSETQPFINIALISGGTLCLEVLQMTTTTFSHEDVHARIVAVAEPDPGLPGLALARERGLTIVADYQSLYASEHEIQLFILLDPSPNILADVLATKPADLRVLSYPAFNLFWNAFKAKERLLQERTMEMETILNGIEDFFLVISPDQRILEANEAFLQHMGYKRDQVIGKRCYEVHHKNAQECFSRRKGCPIGEVVRNRRPAQTTRSRTDSQGKTHYMKVSLYPVWEKSGKISRFLEISHDITDLKRREEENRRQLERMVEERTRQLEETHRQLLHNDKMASLGKLSASVVHEINNPIAGILNLILLMKRIRNDPPEADKVRGDADRVRGDADRVRSDADRVRSDADRAHNEAAFDRYLDLMEAETRRISRIVSNLLTFSRQSKIALTRLNLNQLVKKTVFLNENLLKINHVNIHTRLEPRLPAITASADQLQQVFMNMISNATEAMEAGGGGTLTIETDQDDDFGGVRVRFKDTGVGISPENRDKLFEPFFTTKKKSKGVGLGLSVAYGIIKAHQGAIAIDSTFGVGTTFTIQLPIAPSGQNQKPDNAPSEPKAEAKPEDR